MNATPRPSFVVVGRIGRPHGIEGEFFVSSLTDHPDATFASGVTLRVADERGKEPDEFFPPLHVQEARPFQDGYLVRFQGVVSRTQAEFLTNRHLLRPFSEVEPAGEGELFYHEILGMRVVTGGGRDLGTVREMHFLEPADLLEVSDGEREYLIPYTRRVVEDVDPEARRIVVDPPEGLLDL